MARPRKLIGEFLIELSEDKRGFSNYLENPESVLAESGLTKSQQKLLLSNNLARIRDAVRDEYKTAKVILFPMFVGVKRPSGK